MVGKWFLLFLIEVKGYLISQDVNDEYFSLSV